MGMFASGWFLNLGAAVVWGIFAILAVKKNARWLLTPVFVTLGLRVFSLAVTGGAMYRAAAFTMILNLIAPALLVVALFLRKGTPCFLMSLIAGCLEAFLLVISLISMLGRGMSYGPGYIRFIYLGNWLLSAALALVSFGVALHSRRA